MRDLVDFIRAHWWAFAAAAKAEWHKRRDQDQTVPLEELPRWLKIVLRPREDPVKRRKAMLAFAVEGVTSLHVMHLDRVDSTTTAYTINVIIFKSKKRKSLREVYSSCKTVSIS